MLYTYQKTEQGEQRGGNVAEEKTFRGTVKGKYAHNRRTVREGQ